MNAHSEPPQSPQCLFYATAQHICDGVSQELADTNRTSLRDIRCDYQQGVLYLQGHVSTFFLKQLAQEHARRVVGVTRIINCIQVVSS